MWQRLATRHIAEFLLRRDVGFKRFDALDEVRRKRLRTAGQRTKTERGGAGHPHAKEVPPGQALMFEKEAFRVFHGVSEYQGLCFTPHSIDELARLRKPKTLEHESEGVFPPARTRACAPAPLLV